MNKSYKIVLLVALALLLTLTACNRPASTAPVTVTTPTGEAPFPFTTPGDVGRFGTQTAIASTPGAGDAATTPQVIISTETPAAGGEQTDPGAAAQPEATAAPQAEGQSGAVSVPALVRPETYILQKGEWPICIARRYNLDLGQFFAANGMNMNSKPAAGTSLKIPSGGSWSANYGARSLREHPTTYTVVAGDTVYSIACRFGDVDPAAILAVNGLGSAGDVKAGQSLKIP